MAYVLQAKSDDLTQIQKEFASQEEAIKQLKQNLTRVEDQLKQGWIGPLSARV